MSCWMSSSRVHTTLTGPPLAWRFARRCRPCPLRAGGRSRRRADDCARSPCRGARRRPWPPLLGPASMHLRADPDLAGARRQPGRCSSSAPSARAPRTAARTRHRLLRPATIPLAMSPTDFATTPSFLLAARRSAHIWSERDLRVRTFVPGDDESVEAFLGGPHMVADNGNDVVQHNDLADARDRFGGAVIDMLDLAAEYRARRQRGELHPWQHRVDAVDHLSVGLVRRIEPFERLADQREIFGILQRRSRRRRQLRDRVTRSP